MKIQVLELWLTENWSLFLWLPYPQGDFQAFPSAGNKAEPAYMIQRVFTADSYSFSRWCVVTRGLSLNLAPGKQTCDGGCGWDSESLLLRNPYAKCSEKEGSLLAYLISSPCFPSFVSSTWIKFVKILKHALYFSWVCRNNNFLVAGSNHPLWVSWKLMGSGWRHSNLIMLRIWSYICTD